MTDRPKQTPASGCPTCNHLPDTCQHSCCNPTPAPSPEPTHSCGLQGFGRGIDGSNDRCPACQAEPAPVQAKERCPDNRDWASCPKCQGWRGQSHNESVTDFKREIKDLLVEHEVCQVDLKDPSQGIGEGCCILTDLQDILQKYS